MARRARAKGAGPAGGPVRVELSPAQVQRVLGDASAAGYLSLSPTRPSGPDGAAARAREEPVSSRLSRSLLQGLSLLAALPTDGSYVRVIQVADMLGMSQSSAHRYLVTLLALELVEQDPLTRQYRLADVP